MKKSKGILTPAEKEVAKRNRTIIILCLVLVLSLAINVLFVFDLKITLPKYKIVKMEETEVENEVSGDETEKSVSVSDDSEDEETAPETSEKKEPQEIPFMSNLEELARAEAYENAETISFPEGSIDSIKVISDDFVYELTTYDNQLRFYAKTNGNGTVSCRFVKEKFDEFSNLINAAELKEITTTSYADENGKIINYTINDYIYVNEYTGGKWIYPPDNWDAIVDYCKELEKAARE